MSNLSIIERYDFKNLSPDLTKSQLEIINARRSETVKSLIIENSALFYAEILKAFDLALMLAGHKKEESDYFNQVKACSRALESNFNIGKYGSITVNELNIAVERGCSGQYGEFMGINYVTLNKFILGYVQEMNEAITKQRLHENDLKYKRDQKEKAEQARKEYEESFEGIIEADIQQKKLNPMVLVEDYGNVKFASLKNEGRIVITEDQKERLKRETLTMYADQVGEERKTHNGKQAALSSNQIKVVYTPPSKEDSKVAKNRIYKLLAYNEWLKEQKELKENN